MRTNKFLRAFTQGFLTMFFVLILMWKDWPSVVDILLLLGICVLVGLAVGKLYEFHADIYPIYYIKDNTREIRKKLDIEDEKEPKSPGSIKTIPHHSIVKHEIEADYEW